MENESGVKITITSGSGNETTGMLTEGDPLEIVSALTASLAYYIKNFSCEAQNDDTTRIFRAKLALQCMESIAEFMLEEETEAEKFIDDFMKEDENE